MSNEYSFDPAELANIQIEGEMATKTTPIPEKGNPYPAQIREVTGRAGESTNNSGEARKWQSLVVSFNVEVGPDIAAELGREPGAPDPVSSMMLFLDLDESGTGLALGTNKNVKLGKLREAVGQNGPGPWTPKMLEGQPCRVIISHNVRDGDTFDQVSKVLPL